MRFSLRTALLTALLMTLPSVAAGQLTLGFRGGLSLASLGGDDAGSVDSRTGLALGGFFKLPLPGVLGVQVGAGFVQKGFEETELGVDFEFNLGYIELPLLLTFSPPTTGNVGFNFFVGPALGFNTGCNFSATEGGVTVNVDCDDPSLDAPVKSVDLGAMVGAGLDIGLTGNVSLVLDVLYNFGLTKIPDSGSGDTKNRAFSILAGLSFSVGG